MDKRANVITFHNPIKDWLKILLYPWISYLKEELKLVVGRGIYGREAINLNIEADMKDQAKNFRLFEETLTILKKSMERKIF